MECKTQLAEPGGSEDPSQLLPLLHSHLTHEPDKWKQVGIRRELGVLSWRICFPAHSALAYLSFCISFPQTLNFYLPVFSG